MKYIHLFASVLLWMPLCAQEICDNALDDDGDGLVDLLDPDCDCGPEPFVILEDFENFDCCPDGFTPGDAAPDEGFNCLDTDWTVANNPSWSSPDFLHTCGYLGSTSLPAPTPFPSGDGALGMKSFEDGSCESIARCLPCSLLEGASYDISFYVGFGEGYEDFPISSSTSPVEFAVYGKTNCINVPAVSSAYACLEFFGWNEIGTFTVTGNPGEWVLVTGSFVADDDYQAIGFGKSCGFTTGPTTDLNEYHYIDKLELTGNSFGNTCLTPQIEVTGDCVSGYTLGAVYPASETFQWYKNGIALVGQTDSTLVVYGDYSNTDSIQVRVIDAFGDCVRSAPVVLEVDYDDIEIELLATSPGCPGDETGQITSTVNSPNLPLEYVWNTGATVDSLTEVGAGEYGLTVTDTLGCFGQASATVLDPDSIVVSATVTPPELCSSGEIAVAVRGGTPPYNLIWDNGISGTQNQGLSGGEYGLSVVDGNGCSLEQSYSIAPINPEEYGCYFPNAFTPDGDGTNESWCPVVGDATDFEVRIFDRWGTLIYTLDADHPCWIGNILDGKYYVPAGTYSYSGEVTTCPGQNLPVGGHVTVVR